MMAPYQRRLTLSFSLGLVALIAQVSATHPANQTVMMSQDLQVNELQLNTLRSSNISVNGVAANPSADTRSDWRDPATVQVNQPNRSLNTLRLEGSQLTVRVSE